MIDGEPVRENEGMQLYQKTDAPLNDGIFVGKYYPVGDLGKIRLMMFRGDVLERLRLKRIGGLYMPDHSTIQYGKVNIFLRKNIFHLGLHLKQPESMRKGLAVSVGVTNPRYSGPNRFELKGNIGKDGLLDEFVVEDSGKRQKLMFFVKNNPLVLESLRFRFFAQFTDSLEKENH